MKNRVLLMSLAVLLTLSAGHMGCGGETVPETGPDTIKVGLVRDLDGILAFYDQAVGGPVYRAFTQWVNDQGGIDMSAYGKKKEIELVIRDYDPVTPGDLAAQTEALITEDEVHFLWGGPSNITIYPQAPIANAYGIVLMTLECGAADMMADPEKLPSWPYVWVNLSFSNWYQIPVLYDMLVAQGVSEPRAYLVYIDNEWGREYHDTTINVFGAENVIAVGHDPFSATTDDIEDMIADAKAALGDPECPDYDIFCAFTYEPHLGYIITAADALDFNPAAMIMGPGAHHGIFLMRYDGLLEGVLSFAVANRHTEIDQPVTLTLNEMFDLIEPAASGGFPTEFTWDVWGDAIMWAGLEMWKEAVETVGHLDAGYSAEVRKVLASFTEEDPATTVIGDCWYYVHGDGLGGGVIDYQAMPGQIGQWQDGYVEIVGYEGITDEISKYDVTAQFIYPMTDLWFQAVPAAWIQETLNNTCLYDLTKDPNSQCAQDWFAEKEKIEKALEEINAPNKYEKGKYECNDFSDYTAAELQKKNITVKRAKSDKFAHPDGTIGEHHWVFVKATVCGKDIWVPVECTPTAEGKTQKDPTLLEGDRRPKIPFEQKEMEYIDPDSGQKLKKTVEEYQFDSKYFRDVKTRNP